MSNDELKPHALGQGSAPAPKAPSLAPAAGHHTTADLEKRITVLEAKPKRVPPKPRKPLPWPRAARDIAWIVCVTAVIIALIGFWAVATVMLNLPLAIQ